MSERMHMVGLSRLVTNAGYMQHFLSSLGLLGLLNLLRIKLQVSIQERQHLAISQDHRGARLNFNQIWGTNPVIAQKTIDHTPWCNRPHLPRKRTKEQQTGPAWSCSSFYWMWKQYLGGSQWMILLSLNMLFKIFKINPRHESILIIIDSNLYRILCALSVPSEPAWRTISTFSKLPVFWGDLFGLRPLHSEARCVAQLRCRMQQHSCTRPSFAAQPDHEG